MKTHVLAKEPLSGIEEEKEKERKGKEKEKLDFSSFLLLTLRRGFCARHLSLAKVSTHRYIHSPTPPRIQGEFFFGTLACIHSIYTAVQQVRSIAQYSIYVVNESPVPKAPIYIRLHTFGYIDYIR